MDDEVKGLLISFFIVEIVYGFFCSLYYVFGGMLYMEDNLFQGLLIAAISASGVIIAAIITGVISLRIAKSKQIKLLEMIVGQLGIDINEASLKDQLNNALGINSKSVSDQLGVGTDDFSLTKQHKEIKEFLSVKLAEQTAGITSISQMIHDEELRRGSLTSEQMGLLHTVNALVYDWELTHQKLLELENQLRCNSEKITELEYENNCLRQKLEAYRSDDQDVPHDNYDREEWTP